MNFNTVADNDYPKVVTDNDSTKVILFNSDEVTTANLKAIFETAPDWATPGNYEVKKTDTVLVDDYGNAMSLFTKNLTAIIWERSPKPIDTVVVRDDHDFKIVVMALEEYNTNSRALDGLAPDWATPDNFKFKSLTESLIKDNDTVIGLAQTNSIAFLWEKNGRTLKEGLVKAINPATVLNSRKSA